ncbi:HTTM domain-containing protein [Natronococcus wangiae]|uniref:HTTM domain-containing protein n=1 Tax=Natronococcus wangiae TaxID=3068275 RepID=UPI00273F2670|nr:HTTM domain-containing protein [Natronococcus sp. AD5]
MKLTQQSLRIGAGRRSARLEALCAVASPRLGIDLRALGAFRIALGLLVLVDLIGYRLPGLVPFYTDDGVFPRSALAEVYPPFASYSIHAASGSARVQGLLFAIAACVAVCLLVGYRTRLSTGISLALLASLHARNPHVVNGGDTILLSFLFLGLFVPLDARWSLDSDRRPRDRDAGARRACSIATATILLHVVIIYATNAVFKYQSDVWMSGAAVPRIFHVEEYIVLFGPSLAAYPTLLTAVNWLWIFLLTASACLILFAGRLRIALVAAFVGAHLGLAATMRLGIFPFVMIAGLLLFLPPGVWNRAERLVRTGGTKWGFTFSTTSNPGDTERKPTSIASAVTSPRVRRSARAGRPAVLVCFLVAVLLWQAMGVGFVDNPVPGLDDELTEASWAFFAPNPPDSSSWYVVEAELESGETVDAIDGGDVTFDRPPDVAETYPTILWSQYGNEVRYADEAHYEPAAAYVCERAASDTASVTIYHVEQSVDADGPVGDPVPHERIIYGC